MGFDWKQESKEKYFQVAKEKIEVAGFDDFLKIDRSKFAVVAGKIVKVYVHQIQRAGNQRRWWAALREVEGFKEVPAPKNAYGKREKTIFANGYFEIEMEEQDR